jgi:predicted DNA-binding transcriptional regulator YafY
LARRLHARGLLAIAADKTPKIALLLRLLAAIDEGRSSFEELKRKVDEERPPSTRSLRRYLAELSAAGFPWFFDRATGTYRFEGGYSLRRLELSSSEMFGLLALKGIATSLGGTIGESMGEVSEKLARVAGRRSSGDGERSSVRVHMPDPHLDAERGAIFELLQRAQKDRQSVRFAYVDKAGKSSKRHVDVYGFVVSGGRVYAVAFDRGRGAMRVFAVDGISDVAMAPQRFTLPDDFDIEAFAAQSVSGIFHTDETTIVTMRFSPVVAKAARADRVVRERVVRERDDGSIEIDYTVADPLEFVRWAMKWGADGEILRPQSVRDQIAELSTNVASLYSKRNP